MFARVLMLLVAVAGTALMAVWYANARDIERAAEISLHAPTPAEIATAERLLERAGRLSPDTSPEIGRAFLLIRRGEPARAVPLLRDLAAREPRNLLIWRYLSLADPSSAAEARARMERLAPPVR